MNAFQSHVYMFVFFIYLFVFLCELYVKYVLSTFIPYFISMLSQKKQGWECSVVPMCTVCSSCDATAMRRKRVFILDPLSASDFSCKTNRIHKLKSTFSTSCLLVLQTECFRYLGFFYQHAENVLNPIKVSRALVMFQKCILWFILQLCNPKLMSKEMFCYFK